jgi:NitT/TauT family transport system substrate-binding protein
MTLRRLWPIAAAVALLSLLPMSQSWTRVSAQSVPHIHAGTNRNVGGSAIYFAQELGYFKKAGLDVDIQTVTNGAAAANAVLSGALDISEGNVLSIALAHEKGLPLTFIAPLANYSSNAPTSLLMVDKASAITSGADLNGKTLAVNGLSDITQIAAEGWIDAHGGDSRTVRYVEMTFSEMGPALERHTVDAAVVTEPFLIGAKKTARVIGSCYDAIGDHFMVNGWFATNDFIAKNPDVLKRFARALREASDWANHNPKLTDPILTAHTGIPLPLIEQMTRIEYATVLDPRLAQPQLDLAFKYGILHSHMAARDIVYNGGK